MASASVSRAGTEDAPKIEILKGALYEAMTDHGDTERLYTQADLMNFNIIPKNDLTLLLNVIQSLTNDQLLIAVSHSQAGFAWRYRSREDARKYTSLPDQETAIVYALIDEAGSDGIWSRILKSRTKLHESVLKNALKTLETKGYIKDMKSVEHPNKKMYIKASLSPSERATGGPWYTDSNLDEAFILGLEHVIFNFIKRKSAQQQQQRAPTQKQPTKGVMAGRKRPAAEITAGQEDGNTPAPAHAPAHAPAAGGGPRKNPPAYLPYPAGYNRYPTAHEIAEFIANSGITNNTTLSEDDVQQLVDILVYDGLIEPVAVVGGKRKGYRTTRIMKQVPDEKQEPGAEGEDRRLGAEPNVNGYVEAPCGRCPVYELCEEGGPVNPSSCVYYQRWLGLD